MLEIALRNAIDKHYQQHLNQPDWLKYNSQPSGLFYDPSLRNHAGRFEQAEKVNSTIIALRKITLTIRL
jgi:hypothetical protein